MDIIFNLLWRSRRGEGGVELGSRLSSGMGRITLAWNIMMDLIFLDLSYCIADSPFAILFLLSRLVVF